MAVCKSSATTTRGLDFLPIADRFAPNLGSGAIRLACGLFDEKTKAIPMAKATTVKIRLVSTADTGFYYVTKKNSRTMTEKMTKRKYDPVARKHVDFKEAKIK